MLLDSSSSGAFVSSSPADAEALIERISSNTSFWYNKRDSRPSMHEVKESVAQEAKVEAITQEIKILQAVVEKLEAKAQPCMALALYYNVCGGPHDTNICKSSINIEEVEVVNYQQPPKQMVGEMKIGSKAMVGKIRTTKEVLKGNILMARERKEQRNEARDVEERLTKAINDLKRDQGFLRQEITQEIRQEIATVRQEYATSMKNIETQVAQMFRMMSKRPWGAFSSSTENNPKERVNAVMIVSPEDVRKDAMEWICDNSCGEKLKGNEITSCDPLKEEGKKDTSCALKKYLKEVKPPKRKPQTSSKTKMTNAQALEKKGSDYAEGAPQVYLGEEAPALIHKGCTKKKGDPGAFVVNCAIKDCGFQNALANLGASINIMPSHVFNRLKFPYISPTPLTVRLANGTVRYPRGVADDVLVKIGVNLVLVDFVIIDVGENLDVPLILGRPFLATCHALIDVSTDKLTLRINDEEPSGMQKVQKESVCVVKKKSEGEGQNQTMVDDRESILTT
ncbi:PREDICTED: uncharacterized protein LOC109161359 [Ipomoea nil]|uniref:uncharacterized protein LOC109161359 n=1 Tax=Ipomoea nil TaxID=35883 RepID=UPI000901CD19|nr:PREDICTED: uncharacterized protein LOC109161359 [Ipomoea nil]